ncbi:MAG: hypothetical protein LBI99_07890 [Propionibacteriaceae bacterium]|jgi:hypothetical protein|nr:hypothetical protein [Propionibacteriaceae bacterium]
MGDDWGEPDPDDSFLIRKCCELRRKPLGRFDAEDTRIMLGQQISPDTLAPLALGMLNQNPWAGGDMFPGALLDTLLRLPDNYWRDHPAHAAVADSIVDKALATLSADPWLTDEDSGPGSLLAAMLNLPEKYWTTHPAPAAKLKQIALSLNPEELRADWQDDLREALNRWR